MLENRVADNQEQVTYWNGEAGNTWVAEQERMDQMLQPLSQLALQLAKAAAGERVIDIGCGCGDTSIAMGQTGAHVLGVDISEVMLARASERAKNMDNVEFSRGDAAVHKFERNHDLVFSRFGVMFFDNPVLAFTNLHQALASTGRLMFMCWQKPSNNPWMSVGGKAIQPFLEAPAVAPDPRAPGPFAFADQSYVESILSDSGFHNIQVVGETVEMHLGSNLDETVAAQMQIGPIARVVKELEGDQRTKAVEAVRQALAGHMTDRGIWLGASVWLVSATA